jgi:NADH:ubiquinone oxidoreductase subunit D
VITYFIKGLHWFEEWVGPAAEVDWHCEYVNKLAYIVVTLKLTDVSEVRTASIIRSVMMEAVRICVLK